LFTDAVADIVSPACTLEAESEIETEIAKTVTVVEPDFEVSATEVPVMVASVSLAGGVDGA